MKIGVVGLGKMGGAVAYRIHQAGLSVVGYDVTPAMCAQATQQGIVCAASVSDLARVVDAVFLFVPAGPLVDAVLKELEAAGKSLIIVDGGNSNFHDSVRRARELQQKDITFLDCGTSGGVHGKEQGFCLMVGGNKNAYDSLEPVLKAIAAPGGYAYMGPSGAGHYVKMVHNGIEYALLQAYAEGFHLLKEGLYPELDMARIADVWQHGSVIRSWILQLVCNVFKDDQDFKTVSGEVGGGSTGQWTVDAARAAGVPVRLIEDALNIRKESYATGGDYATKLVALLRNQFGGHDVKKLDL